MIRFLFLFVLCAAPSLAVAQDSVYSPGKVSPAAPTAHTAVPQETPAITAPRTNPAVKAAPMNAPVIPMASPPPVVLELFTSQGCAFCPPADELMGQMIGQQGIIGLSCHVDYFGVRNNDLGKGFCTKRQMDYNRHLGKGARYTPQLVVNGRSDFIGYEAGKISAGIMKARMQKIQPVAISSEGADSYSFSLPQISGGAYRVWMAVYDLPKSMAITEGSNFGKTVKYYNVVNRLEDLGEWDGNAMARAINANYAGNNGGIAIIVQNAANGHVVAAGTAPRAPRV